MQRRSPNRSPHCSPAGRGRRPRMERKGALVEAAIYLRLSNADGPEGESDSIQNQRAFL